jgi:hypothetical protein
VKICATGLFGISLVFAASAAAQQLGPQQMQNEQQACEADVYSLCGEAIPDVDRITACLRVHWKDVSHACRTVMIDHARRHNQRRERD